MPLNQSWLDESRGLKWVLWGSALFAPCVVYLIAVGLYTSPDSWLYQQLPWAARGAMAGGLIGIAGWLRLLISRLLRIGR